jgi:LacI family transcriptional regulator
MSDYLVPRLTTVTKDSIGVGREAVKLLLARINNPDLPRQYLKMPPRLIIRESTGPAPF